MNDNIADDVWFEVFLRLPLTEIFKFKCVSKVWLSILSNPHFINKWYKLNSSLWTLILRSSVSKQNPPARLDAGLPNPELNSQFISYNQNVSGFSLRFVNQKHELKNTNLYIIGSSNGLVLCTTEFLSQNNYYVCNPLTQKWVSLPAPPTEEIILHTGFTCESSLISTSFKVIRVSQESGSFKIDIFTSDLGEWNVYNSLYPPGFIPGYSIHDNYVTHNGVFYWMKKGLNGIVAFSTDGNNNHQTCGRECKLINLPDRHMDNENWCFYVSTEKRNRYLHQCLGESEGLICYAIFKHTERSLSVWVLEENWYLLHKDINFYDMLAQMESMLIGGESPIDYRDIQVMGFNPVDKNVVIISYKKHILAYNIRNGGYEQLCHPSFSASNLSGSYLGILTFVLKPRPTMLPPVSW